MPSSSCKKSAVAALCLCAGLVGAQALAQEMDKAPRYGAAGDAGQTDDPRLDRIRYAGSVYYVSCTTGDDRNDGRSPASAWRTLDEVNQRTEVGYWDTVPSQAQGKRGSGRVRTAVASGSAFLFERGCRFNGQINVHALQVGAAKPTYSTDLTFGAYGERRKPRPIIDSSVSTGMRGAIWSNGHTIHIRNLHLVGNPAHAQPGVWLRKSKGSSIVNSTVENMAGDGVHAADSESLLIENSTFRNNQLAGRPGGGVTGSGKNLRLLRNTFVNNGRHKILAHNVYLSSLKGALIQGNHVEGGSNLGVVLHGSCEEVQIIDNDIFGNSNGIDLSGGYPKEAESFTRVLIERNRIHHNGLRPNEQGYGLLLKSLVHSSIRNNLVYANRISPMAFADKNPGDVGSANVTVEHNLFHSPGQGLSFVGSDFAEIVIRNNIVATLSRNGPAVVKAAELPDPALALNANLYYAPELGRHKMFRWGTESYDISDLASRFGQETRGRTGNPSFASAETGDFRLRPGSSAREAGMPTDITADFADRPRNPARPSIGAFE